MNYKLRDFKTPKSIAKRTWTTSQHFSKSQLFHPDFQKTMQLPYLILEENELPIFECVTRNGYVLLTTHYFYSKLNDVESKVEIENILYESRREEILKRKTERQHYHEVEYYSLK